MTEYLSSSEALRKLLLDKESKRTYSGILIGTGSLFAGLGGALGWWSLGGIKSTDFSDAASDIARNPLFNPIENPGLIIDKAVEKFSGLYEFLHGPAGVALGTVLALAGLYSTANEIIWLRRQPVVNSGEGPVYHRLNGFTNNPWRFDKLARLR